MRRIVRWLMLLLGGVLMFPLVGSFCWTWHDDWFNRILDEILRYLYGGFSPPCNVGIAVFAWFSLLFVVGAAISLISGVSLFRDGRPSKPAISPAKDAE